MYVVSIIYEYRSGGIYLHHSLDNCPDPEAFQMHTHDTAEILCFISGKGKYFVEGNYYQLTPGCILIMRSNESHKLHIERTAPYERIALRFPETLLLGIDARALPFKTVYAKAARYGQPLHSGGYRD